jgi:hypothetical protein
MKLNIPLMVDMDIEVHSIISVPYSFIAEFPWWQRNRFISVTVRSVTFHIDIHRRVEVVDSSPQVNRML